MFFYAIDGDDIGRHIEKLILSDNLEDIQAYARTVSNHVGVIVSTLEAHSGTIIFAAGDSVLATCDLYIPLDKLPLRGNDEITFSAGVGRSMTSAWIALKRAKGLGRDRIEQLLDLNL